MPFTSKTRLTIVAVVVFLVHRTLGAPTPGSDLLLIHGHIITVDRADSIAQAVAVRKGFIVKVGTDAEILAFANHRARFRVIDLQGRP